MHRRIEVHCIEFDVNYDITEYIPETQWQPSEGGDIILESVEIDGVDLLEVLSEKTLERIKEEIAELED